MNFSALPEMLSMIPRVIAGVNTSDIETIKAITRKAYPSVPATSTAELAESLEKPGELLLVDVRSTQEFAVSHLRGALNLQTPDSIAQAVRALQPFASCAAKDCSAKAVLYCAVGFRSARLAHALQRRGLEKVFNLEGSIFQWANEGRPLFRGAQTATQVHPYGKRWVGLLRPGLASYPAS
jgi:rhodanese-related sulfurtransferase